MRNAETAIAIIREIFGDEAAGNFQVFPGPIKFPADANERDKVRTVEKSVIGTFGMAQVDRKSWMPQTFYVNDSGVVGTAVAPFPHNLPKSWQKFSTGEDAGGYTTALASGWPFIQAYTDITEFWHVVDAYVTAYHADTGQQLTERHDAMVVMRMTPFEIHMAQVAYKVNDDGDFLLNSQDLNEDGDLDWTINDGDVLGPMSKVFEIVRQSRLKAEEPIPAWMAFGAIAAAGFDVAIPSDVAEAITVEPDVVAEIDETIDRILGDLNE